MQDFPFTVRPRPLANWAINVALVVLFLACILYLAILLNLPERFPHMPLFLRFGFFFPALFVVVGAFLDRVGFALFQMNNFFVFLEWIRWGVVDHHFSFSDLPTSLFWLFGLAVFPLAAYSRYRWEAHCRYREQAVAAAHPTEPPASPSSPINPG